MRSWRFKVELRRYLVVALVVFGASSAFAERIPFDSSSDPETIRSKIVPAVQETLSRICGADCPGFSVHPNVKGETVTETASLEDLGFEDISQKTPESPKELSSVSIEVLTSKKLDAAIQDTVKATVASVARNHTDLPVSVRTKGVTLPPVAATKDIQAVTPRDWLDFAKKSIWPIALLCLALITLLGLAYSFRARRKMALALHEAMNPKKEETSVAVPEPMIVETGPDLQIFSDRFADLKFFLEDCAERGDLESLRKVVRLFPGDALSKNLELSPIVAVMMTKAMAESNDSVAEGGNVRIHWLKENLDKIHWKRLQEASEPIAKVSGLSDSQLASLFTQVNSAEAKAVVLCQIPSEQWPRLMSTLTASQKVAVGTSLSTLQQKGGAIEGAARAEVLSSLDKVVRASHLEDLLDEYVLFLSEEETTQLANQLSSASGLVSRRKSVDDMILNLSDKELLELVLRLEVDQIRTLLENLPTEPQQKVLSGLPKKLRERVGFFSGTTAPSENKSDPKWLQTRSRLFKLYNEVQSRNGSRSIH